MSLCRTVFTDDSISLLKQHIREELRNHFSERRQFVFISGIRNLFLALLDRKWNENHCFHCLG